MADARLLILGAGSFAIEVLEVAELSGDVQVMGFVVSDDFPNPGRHGGLPVYREHELPFGPTDVRLAAGIVTTRRRAFIRRLRDRGFAFRTLVHPSALVSPRAAIGEGVLLGAGTIVASNTHIDDHALLNRGANVGHDNRLAAFATIGPGAILAGGVTIDTGAYIGVGAVVRDHVTVGEGAVVAAGAVVVTSVEPHVLVAGCPATVLRRDVDGL